jgi:uncharacterized protein (DUF1684 family)
MKKIYLLLLLVSSFAFGQGLKNKTDKKQFPAEILEIETFQKELNREYKTEEETPLRGSNFKKFKSHPFFPIDLNYRVKAKLVKIENAVPFEIPTSSGRTKKFREFGKAYFTLNGAEQVLTVYQSLALLDDPEYQDYLFLPFKDETNGKDTYGGGRYLDLRIPQNDELIIDFNKAYHPLCAYNATDYSCPIVPQNNWLQLPIEAGVKYQDIWFEH